MRAELTPVVILLTLSRRNVLSLVHKLGWPGSARELQGTHVYVDGELVDGLLLRVRVEPDDTHYAGRPEPPGRMHPLTEAFLAAATEHPRFIHTLLTSETTNPEKPEANSDDERQADDPQTTGEGGDQ